VNTRRSRRYGRVVIRYGIIPYGRTCTCFICSPVGFSSFPLFRSNVSSKTANLTRRTNSHPTITNTFVVEYFPCTMYVFVYYIPVRPRVGPLTTGAEAANATIFVPFRKMPSRPGCYYCFEHFITVGRSNDGAVTSDHASFALPTIVRRTTRKHGSVKTTAPRYRNNLSLFGTTRRTTTFGRRNGVPSIRLFRKRSLGAKMAIRFKRINHDGTLRAAGTFGLIDTVITS